MFLEGLICLFEVHLSLSLSLYIVVISCGVTSEKKILMSDGMKLNVTTIGRVL